MTGAKNLSARVRDWIAARSLRQMSLAAAAVLLTVSGAFGGLREAATEPVAKFTAGTPHAATPFEITVKGVYWSDDLGEVIGPAELGRFLLVVADIRADTDQSVDGFVIREALRIADLDQAAEPRVVVTADQVALDQLSPGLRYEVAYIWEQDSAEPVPTTVRLQSRAHTFRASTIDGQENWFDVSTDASGTFSVSEFGS